jgi:hypothetical protein
MIGDSADDSGNSHTMSKTGSPADSGVQFIVAAGSLALPVAAHHDRMMRAG